MQNIFIPCRKRDILGNSEVVFVEMSNEEYSKLVGERAKPSPMGKNMLWAFLVGGGICAVGQGLMKK